MLRWGTCLVLVACGQTAANDAGTDAMRENCKWDDDAGGPPRRRCCCN